MADGIEEGLSPRVRGNPGHGALGDQSVGSIPACAGEPPRHRRRDSSNRVYPRVCGGTAAASVSRPSRAGLSPRVRGNHPAAPAAPDRGGSIPACAGEPAGAPRRRPGARVYPRVCGGTLCHAACILPVGGLSPRVRGNHRPLGAPALAGGSIPACAGEPRRREGATAPPRVYPRVCGGTHNTGLAVHVTSGLSPRVRGNQPDLPGTEDDVGSIPACAGEPP